MTPTVLRRCQIGLLSVGVVVTVGMALLVAGCYRDDAAIERNLGVATADVLSVSGSKAAVGFLTQSGEYRSPRLGAWYPIGLSQGQRLSIEYDTTNPDNVRVAGRDASLAWRPALSVAGFTWLAVIALMFALATMGHRRTEGRSPEPTPASADSTV